MGAGSEHDAEPPVAEVYRDHTPVAVGTVVWALLFVIGLFLRAELADTDREWWVWSAAAGVALGIFGYFWLRRRSARISAATITDPEASAPPTGTTARTPDRS